MILSWGAAYSGFQKWLLACDLRDFDYHDAAGFGDGAGFDAAGAITGLGWKSVFSVHAGAQYQATQRLSLRLGYEFNTDPIDSSTAFFNVASPLIIQDIASVGLSFAVRENVILSAAYLHGFENSVSGPFQVPGVGPIPGTSVTSRVSADAAVVGVTVRY